jgi:hypothetical protein
MTKVINPFLVFQSADGQGRKTVRWCKVVLDPFFLHPEDIEDLVVK